jgi:hypothetical protein
MSPSFRWCVHVRVQITIHVRYQQVEMRFVDKKINTQDIYIKHILSQKEQLWWILLHEQERSSRHPMDMTYNSSLA